MKKKRVAEVGNMENRNIRRYCLFPKPIAKSVEPLVKPVFKKHGFAEHRILTDWEKIVGRDLAACSLPQKLTLHSSGQEGGILHVLVASARAVELQHMLPVIADNIATYFGYRAVQKIKIHQTSASVFQRPAKKIFPEKHKPSEKLTAALAGCTDPDLREALLSLGNIIESTNR